MIFAATLAALVGLEQEVWRYILNHKEWDGTGRKALEDVVEDQDFWDQQGGTFLETAGAGCAKGEGRRFTTEAEADEWAKANQKWGKNLTPEEKKALDNYTTYVGVNDRLRGSGPFKGPLTAADDQLIAGLDSVFARPGARLEESVVVHRAWQGSGISGKKVGATFTDKGYTSTAMSSDASKRFQGYYAKGAKSPTMVEIRAPAGTRAIYVGTAPNGAFDALGDSELLLSRGTTYRVIEQGTRTEAYTYERVVQRPSARNNWRELKVTETSTREVPYAVLEVVG